MFGVVMGSGAIVAAWFAGEGRISRIFETLQRLQLSPPLWLEVPLVTGELLIAPAVILFLVALLITRLSPQPQAWSRFATITILLALAMRYVVWRSLSTLNLSEPLQGAFSLGLYAMEMLVLAGNVIQLLLLVKVRDRTSQADELSRDVQAGAYCPNVDILIPTYNEPEFILRRTVVGCQALDYPHKTIYLLDDTRRPHIKALAQSLGCEYVARPHNEHAKAGNLNHAIPLTESELIVVFDADFVPTTNFLTRTVGFFQDEAVGLVQTPQTFYNPDPIARNLGLENTLTPEEEVFYRQIQPMRDGSGSVVCSGTSFVMRRSAIEATGGFVTDSLSEDYFTGIRLAAEGYEAVYLDEKLSAGLAAENIAAHATQRLRWARGTLQGLFIDANPLTISGLTFVQRLGHLEGLLHWFSSIARVVFLLMPLAYSFLLVIPIQATAAELMYYSLPFYLVQLTVFAWLNRRSRSALLSDIYSLVLVFPLAFTVIQVMLNPFARGFKVTPKGTTSDRFTFNWSLAWPLVALFIITAFSLWRNLGLCLSVDYRMVEHWTGMSWGWIWSAYNLMMVGIALLILLDVPNPDPYEWFGLRRIARLRVGDLEWWGTTDIISEVGACVELTQAGFPVADTPLEAEFEIVDAGICIPVRVVKVRQDGTFPSVQLAFAEDEIDLGNQRRLIEMLFCRPGQWQRRNTPGELRSIWLIFKILLRPRVLTRDTTTRAISVAQI
ncbi:MAG: glycosyltransferase [Cyanobacteria bacterium P01_F01_bin.33]